MNSEYELEKCYWPILVLDRPPIGQKFTIFSKWSRGISRDLLTQNLFFKNINVKDNEFFMCAKSDSGSAPMNNFPQVKPLVPDLKLLE